MNNQEALPEYKSIYQWVEGGFIVAFVVSWTASIIGHFREGHIEWTLLTVISILSAGFLADLVSGLVHWGADTWGSTRTPLVGSWLIRSFREHHTDPLSIVRHNFVETNGANAVGSAAVVLTAWFIPWSQVSLFLLYFAFWISLTNQVHKWAHQSEVPFFILWLQRIFILSVDEHKRHHSGAYDQSYCITLGWLNRPLNAIGFFRALEFSITKVTGYSPRESAVSKR